MNKYLKAVSYNLIYFLLSTIAYLVLTPMAIKVMGEEFYGLWTILFAVGQFGNVGALGISHVVNKCASEISEADAEHRNVLVSSSILMMLGMGLCVGAVLLVFRNAMVRGINPPARYEDQFAHALLIFPITLLLQFEIKVFHGYFLSLLRNRFVRMMDFVHSVFPILGGVLISFFRKDLVWLTLWNILMGGIVFWVYFIRLKATHCFRWTPSKDAIKKLMTFSKFMFVESVAILLFQQFDRILVGMLLGPAAAGIYSVATSVGLRISMVLGNITEVMIPFASRKFASGKADEVGWVFRKLSQVTSLIIALGGGMLILWMREILGLWISPAYAEANSLFFRIIILAYSLLSLSRPAHQTLTGLGKVRFSSLVYLITSCSVLGVIYLLSSTWGLLGASLGNLVSILLLSMNVWVYRWMGSRNRFAELIEDLKYGFFIPILAQVVSCFDAAVFGKMLISLVLLGFPGWVLIRDEFLRAQLRQLSSRYLTLPRVKQKW